MQLRPTSSLQTSIVLQHMRIKKWPNLQHFQVVGLDRRQVSIDEVIFFV